MKHTIRKTAAISAVVVTLIAGPALAQGMGDWDSNSDSMLDQNEFSTGWADNNAFGTWDADSDGLLSQDEFDAGVFGGYDQDDNGMIDEPEFGDAGDDMGDGGFWDI